MFISLFADLFLSVMVTSHESRATALLQTSHRLPHSGRARELGLLVGNTRFAATNPAVLNKRTLRMAVAGSSCQDISTMGFWGRIVPLQ